MKVLSLLLKNKFFSVNLFTNFTKYVIISLQRNRGGHMNIELVGNHKNILKCELNANEKIYAEAGCTLWKSQGITKTTKLNGGIIKGIGRVLTGENLFLNTYTCESEKGEIAFTPNESRKILEFNLKQGEKIICQKGSYFCADTDVVTSTVYTKQLGEGLFMKKILGPCKVFVAINNNTIEKELKEGESYEIDAGQIAAMSNNAKLFRNGFSKTVVKGPGKIWVEQYRF